MTWRWKKRYLPVGKPFVFGKKFLQGKCFSYITICCGCINILVRHYGRLVPPWGVGTTSGYYARTSDSYYLSINFLLTFYYARTSDSNYLSLSINQILWDLSQQQVKPLSQNDKDFSAPLFLLSALLVLFTLRIVPFFAKDF